MTNLIHLSKRNPEPTPLLPYQDIHILQRVLLSEFKNKLRQKQHDVQSKWSPDQPAAQELLFSLFSM